MNRWLIALVILSVSCGDDSPTGPTLSPSPSPSPSLEDNCTILQTEIIATDDRGRQTDQWSYQTDVIMEARFVFKGQQRPGFTGAGCPQLTAVTAWLLLPINLCGQFGNIFSNRIMVSCLRPGTLDVTVTPTQLEDGVSPPQGRAVFDIQP